MFWQAEDVQPVVNAAVKIFGPQGTVEFGKSVIYNASIFTRKLGKLWYGDLDTNNLSNRLNSLSAAINMTVYVVDDNFDVHVIPN
jgi:hypothetical protein